MEYTFKAEITPKFKIEEIYTDTIGKDWIRFQELVAELGEHILAYMQNYINSHISRAESNGTLANAMKLDVVAGAGEASVGWGIGYMPTLDVEVPYWYLINFGGLTTIAKEGRGVGGYFGGGDAPDSIKRGSGVGTQRFHEEMNTFMMFPKSPIKPMNYIENSRQQLDREINKILQFIRTRK